MEERHLSGLMSRTSPGSRSVVVRPRSSPVCARLNAKAMAVEHDCNRYVLVCLSLGLDIWMSGLLCIGSWERVSQCLAGNRQQLEIYISSIHGVANG